MPVNRLPTQYTPKELELAQGVLESFIDTIDLSEYIKNQLDQLERYRNWGKKDKYFLDEGTRSAVQMIVELMLRGEEVVVTKHDTKTS